MCYAKKYPTSSILAEQLYKNSWQFFLSCIGHGESMRKLGEYFQHSTESIYRLFKDVLKAILSLHNEYIKLPDSSASVHMSIGPNSQNYLFKVVTLSSIFLKNKIWKLVITISISIVGCLGCD